MMTISLHGRNSIIPPRSILKSRESVHQAITGMKVDPKPTLKQDQAIIDGRSFSRLNSPKYAKTEADEAEMLIIISNYSLILVNKLVRLTMHQHKTEEKQI